MTDEAKKLVEALREDAEWAHANEWETPITLGDHLREAADMIEQLDEENAGLDILLTSAQSAAETWQRRAEAAERDITPSCVYCKHSYLNRPGIGNCVYADAFECVGNARFEWRGVLKEEPHD